MIILQQKFDSKEEWANVEEVNSNMEDANDLVYLRARYYDPELGIFLSLDPIEGSTEQPQSINRYNYVQNNPVNLTDPSGLTFSCTGAAQVACQDFDDALQRGQGIGLPFSPNHSGDLSVDTLGDLITQAQSAFGVTFFYNTQQLTLDNCLTCIDPAVRANLPSAQTTVLRGIAALIHTAAQIGTLTSVSSALPSFRNLMARHTIFMRFNANPGGTRTTTGLTSPSGPDMQLGTNMSVAGIIHEMGHAFDRIGGVYSLSAAMANRANDPLKVSPQGISGNPGDPAIHVAYESQFGSAAHPPRGVTPQPLPGDRRPMLGQDGMTGRARDLTLEASTTGGEIFPDMFMNWVLGSANPYNWHPGDTFVGPPGWDGSIYGTAKAAYVALAVQQLINGTPASATPAATQAATVTPYPPVIPNNVDFVNAINQAIQNHVVGNYPLP